jgi:hypothetical protein
MLINMIRIVLSSISLFFLVAILLYMFPDRAIKALPTMIVQTGTQVVIYSIALADVILGYAQVSHQTMSVLLLKAHICEDCCQRIR